MYPSGSVKLRHSIEKIVNRLNPANGTTEHDPLVGNWLIPIIKDDLPKLLPP